MKKMLFFLLIGIVFATTSCDTVQPNYKGVLMENYGKSGKSDFSLVNGCVWTMSPGTELYQTPLWEQRADFEGRVLNLKSSDNTAFGAKPTYSYRIIPERAVDVVFDNKQLKGDNFMKAIEDNIIEPRIYDLIKEESRKFITDTLMATGGSLKFEERLQELIRSELNKKGFELLTFSGQLEFSDKVNQKIDTRNEVNTNITVIDQKIIEQRKQNELAELESQFNQIRSKGLTKEILKEMEIGKWNGVYYGDRPSFIKDVK